MDAKALLSIAFGRLCNLQEVWPSPDYAYWDEKEAEAWLIKIAKGSKLWYHVNGSGFAEPILKKG